MEKLITVPGVRILKCKRCGWEWASRKPAPKACPRCKSYDWNKAKRDVKKSENEL